jgi:primary-amine oxidase
VTANPHPLDPVTSDEFLAGRQLMAAAGLLAEPVRFAYYGLEEPPKDEVLGGAAGSGGPPGSGDTADRRLRAFLINLKTGESTDVVVSLGGADGAGGGVVSARTVDTATEGQLPIVDSEYVLVEEIVHADPGWRAAMERRGLTDMSEIRICPITAGSYRAPAEDDERRIVRVLAFL